MKRTRQQVLAALFAVTVLTIASGCSDSDDNGDGGDDSEVDERGGVTTQPIDGGEFTWDNGVTMRLSIERTEPWGDTDDYCGDGSCGISEPDDLRLLLRYEISVPEDADEPLEETGLYCPGQLSTVDGASDDLVIGVAGEYASDPGTILPGATKFGIDETSIDRSLLGQEFLLESSCGDPDGETAYFTGVIDE